MPDEQKTRKRIIVEEIGQEIKEQPVSGPQIKVPPETKPHVEPGIHEITKEEDKTPSSPLPQKTEISPFWIIIPGVFLLGALLGGIVYYQKNAGQKNAAPATPTAIPSPLSSPIVTPQPTVNLSKYEIRVLNGSGIAGEANRAKTLLEKAGFAVSSTGNAAHYSYTKTIIQAKDEIEKAFITKLSEALTKVYVIDPKTETLSATASDKIVVIIGSSKK